VWGLDLSGSEQGAGGVGGLLFIGNRSSVMGDYAAAYDGNGNVMSLLDMAGAGLAAAYEYGPFGELIRSTGSMSESNPFRFSTKYQDDETGLLYYGYRYYQPVTGRWLSRDPLEEDGGENIYAFVSNDAVNRFDEFGLFGSDRNQCSIASVLLPGKLDRNTISNYAGDSEYLARVSVRIIIIRPIPPLPGPGTPPGQGTGPIHPPSGFPIGSYWLPMNSHVASGVSCRKKNICKGTCTNPCCNWEKEWQEDYLYGRVVATLRDPSAPAGSLLRWVGAWCDIRPSELARGLSRCRSSSVACN
jgi:RHS repeat-associated protein